MQESNLIDRAKRQHDVIMMCRFGSHLYGTNTPESDVDYKGVFLPSREEIFLGRIPKSVRYDSKPNKAVGEKNTAEDIDCEFYSLHYFIELCCKGETAALDMLHANSANILFKNYVWDNIVFDRDRFYTKNLKAFVGYARKQAAKYGLKGTRLAVAEGLRDVLERQPYDRKLKDIQGYLPVNEHCRFMGKDHNNIELYQWCGKQVQLTAKVEYTLKMVRNFIDTFGERARLAKANEGIDWKAMSHAIRAATEVKEILTKKTITFPLANAECLKDIKLGHHDFTGYVLPMLEELMEEVEELSEKSGLPEKVNRRYWDEFIINEVSDWR
jgi:hypothetical protein